MGKVNLISNLEICLSNHQYNVHIGNNLLEDSLLLQNQIQSNQALIVTNTTVSKLYLEPVVQALSSIQCDIVILEDGEKYKNRTSLSIIYDNLIKNNHNRDTTILALGGGVIGDISAFAASTYQRGVSLVHLPTTLLAQVDSSIGGKTGINHIQAKNMIGSFYHPDSVIMDVNTLTTLPNREFRSGIAEVIKYGLLVGGDFLDNLSEILSMEVTSKSADLFVPIIKECCAIKADIVFKDEREHSGLRQILNLGHTFAHALEVVTNYQRWLHGEAVAIGLYMAALLSHQIGNLSEDDLDFVDLLLKKAHLPSRIPSDIDLDVLQTVMLSDKKVRRNVLPFVLLKSIGDCYLDTKVINSNLRTVLHMAVSDKTFKHLEVSNEK
ncbi:MAG: 3-dehydroquinate synthase [Legionellaceae bacterium]|nr:3-dehydroquinate synthase [Legionellaceae bacterium]